MWLLIRALTAPLISLIFVMIASGFFNTFVSIRLEIAGVGPEGIGFVTSALYAGILIGSLYMDQWVMKVGHIRSFVTLVSILTSLCLLQALWIAPWYWATLRLMGGICTAGVFIIIESWLLIQSGPKLRSRILSVYLMILYGAVSLGQLLIDAADPLSFFPFILAALLVACSILPITVKKVTEPLMKEAERLNLLQLFRTSPLGFVGGIISGMLLSVVFGLAPVYAKEMGMSISEIGTFMAVLIFGGLSLQWPVGRWADKADRRCVIRAMGFLSSFIGLGFIWAGDSYLLHLVLAWLLGAFSFTLYPLSMAYACERVQESQIIAATGGFVLSYGIGAICGPLMAPIAINLFGPLGLFYFLTGITTILGVVSFKSQCAL